MPEDEREIIESTREIFEEPTRVKPEPKPKAPIPKLDYVLEIPCFMCMAHTCDPIKCVKLSTSLGSECN